MLCDPLGMPTEDEDFPTGRDSHWRLLPHWVKAVTVLIGLPAWLVCVAGMLRGDFGSSYLMTAFAVFGCVALLQIVCTLRAALRMEY